MTTQEKLNKIIDNNTVIDNKWYNLETMVKEAYNLGIEDALNDVNLFDNDTFEAIKNSLSALKL
jgi:hypothetical protein